MRRRTDLSRKPEPMRKLLYTPAETAEMLSISLRTLYDLTESRRVMAIHLRPGGRAKRYHIEEVERFIAANQYTPDTSAVTSK